MKEGKTKRQQLRPYTNIHTYRYINNGINKKFEKKQRNY